MWRGRRGRAAAEPEAAAPPQEPGPAPVRPWDWAVRQGGPERIFWAEVRAGGEEALVALVSAAPVPALKGYGSASVAVDGRGLRLTSYYVEDPENLAAQTRVLADLASSEDVSVESWTVYESHDARSWVIGESSAALRVYLGLEPEPADALGRGWTFGLRGAVEDGVVVRVRPGDVDRLVELVRHADLSGFVKNWAYPPASTPGRPALSYVEQESYGYVASNRSYGVPEDQMQFDRVEVQGNHLVLRRDARRKDAPRHRTQDALLLRLLESGIEVDRWSKGERYDGRPWADGRGTASLREHLGA